MFVFLALPPFPRGPPPGRYHLVKLLEKFGNVKQFDFLFHKSGPLEGQPRGYCFVNFNTREVRAAWRSGSARIVVKLWIIFVRFIFLWKKTTRCWYLILKCRLNQSKKCTWTPFFYLYKRQDQITNIFTESFSTFCRCWCRFTDRSL